MAVLRLAIFLIACLGLGWSSIARAQDMNRGGLRIALVGGMASGPGVLWEFDRLPLVLPPSCGRSACTRPDTLWDTVAVRQSSGAGAALEVSFAGSLSRWLGFGGTLELHMLGFDSGCEMVHNSSPTLPPVFPGTQPEQTNPNPGNCSTVDQDDDVLAVLGLMPFVEFRVPTGVLTKPFVRLSAGMSVVPNTTNMVTQFKDIVQSDGSGSTRPAFNMTFGVEFHTGMTVQLGLKRRRFDVVTAVAGDASATFQSEWRNYLGFVAGFFFGLSD